MHKGYKCLDRSTLRIYLSHDVVFDESMFSFASSVGTVNSNKTDNTMTTMSLSVLSSSPISSLYPSHEPVVQDDNMRNYNLSMLSTDNAETGTEVLAGRDLSGDSTEDNSSHIIFETSQYKAHMQTRLRNNKTMSKEYHDGTIRYSLKGKAFFAEPVSYLDALTEPQWKTTMKAEFSAL